jgi:hypothetical protein
MSGEYLQQFGGLTTQCTCGQEIQIPVVAESVAPAAPASLLNEPVRDAAIYGTGIWRDGFSAIVARGARLPHRCFRCNAAAERAVPFLLKWAEPEERGKALARDLIEKTRQEQILVTAHVCSHHARRLRFWRWLSPGLLLAGIAALAVASVFEVQQTHDDIKGAIALAGLVLLIAGSLLRIVRVGQPVAGRIDHNQAVVHGFGLRFLDSLPSWAAARVSFTDRTAASLERLTD